MGECLSYGVLINIFNSTTSYLRLEFNRCMNIRYLWRHHFSESRVRSSRLLVSGVEISTICMLEGNHWRNNSKMFHQCYWPRSCCIQQDSFLFHNSLALISCCNLQCTSDTAICLMSRSMQQTSQLSRFGHEIHSFKAILTVSWSNANFSLSFTVTHGFFTAS